MGCENGASTTLLHKMALAWLAAAVLLPRASAATSSTDEDACCNQPDLDLPVVDLAAKQEVAARQLEAASASHGFMLLVNHGCATEAAAAA